MPKESIDDGVDWDKSIGSILEGSDGDEVRKVKKLRKMVLLSLQMDESDKAAKKQFKKAIQNMEDQGKVKLDADGTISLLEKKSKKKKRPLCEAARHVESKRLVVRIGDDDDDDDDALVLRWLAIALSRAHGDDAHDDDRPTTTTTLPRNARLPVDEGPRLFLDDVLGKGVYDDDEEEDDPTTKKTNFLLRRPDDLDAFCARLERLARAFTRKRNNRNDGSANATVVSTDNSLRTTLPPHVLAKCRKVDTELLRAAYNDWYAVNEALRAADEDLVKTEPLLDSVRPSQFRTILDTHLNTDK